MNMREKMARAISAANGDTPWEELDMEIQGLFFIDADAALSALAKPTEAMVAAGGDELLADWDDPIGATTAIFHAMLAKAKEG